MIQTLQKYQENIQADDSVASQCTKQTQFLVRTRRSPKKKKKEV